MKELRMGRVCGWGLTAIAVVLTSVMSAQTDTVQGTASVGTTKVTLTSGMAVSYKGPSGQLFSVLLSDKPADRKAFAADTAIGAGESLVPGIFEGAWKAQHFGKKLSGFTFTVGAKANLLSEEFLVGGKNNTFGLGDEYVIEIKSTSPRLVGRIRTKTPIVEAGSTKAGLDATFDLAVERRP
jgi:hypothetical protein